MSDDSLLILARLIGILGLGLLTASGIGGVLMASRTSAQVVKKYPWSQGKFLPWHRLCSLVGASLFLLHPIPLLFAFRTTSMNLSHVLIPFTAPKQTLWIGIGTIAAYILLIVTLSSLWMKRIGWVKWRLFHYGTYLVFGLGLCHGLFISGEFKTGETLEWDEPEKLILFFFALIVLAFPIWRIYVRQKLKKERRK